jgi:hypothetical protein
MESAKFDVTFSEDDSFRISFKEESPFKVDFGPTIEKEYHGSYSVTPAAEAQTLHTTNKVLVEDITIGPIPDNYGLITWNGSELTVS